MKLDEWLTTVPIKQTPKGARLDLRLHVYPDGHGDFCVEDEKGRSCSKPQPVNNPAESARSWRRSGIGPWAPRLGYPRSIKERRWPSSLAT